jgi:hypothetical protein
MKHEVHKHPIPYSRRGRLTEKTQTIRRCGSLAAEIINNAIAIRCCGVKTFAKNTLKNELSGLREKKKSTQVDILTARRGWIFSYIFPQHFEYWVVKPFSETSPLFKAPGNVIPNFRAVSMST